MTPQHAAAGHRADPEWILHEFEQAWQTGAMPHIPAFLQHLDPGTNDPAGRIELLQELIKIDLDYRWRAPKPGPLGAGLGQHPWVLEDYLAQFPELGTLERLPLDLIGEEYRVRQLWGDKPGHSAYGERFPSRGAELLQALRQIDAELASERVRAGRVSFGPESAHRAAALPGDPVALALPVLSTATALLELLLQHGLISPMQAAEAVALPSRGEDTHRLAARLVERGWLTAWQVEQVFAGRGHQMVIGPYVLLERLGEGGAGQVFKARHQKLGRLAALKLIRPEHLTDPAVVARFAREIRSISQLEHPHIVRAYDAGPIGAAYFLAMEFIDGIDLDHHIKQSGPLPVLVACEFVRQAALGLSHIHEHGLVHRDIKPSNLLVSGGVVSGEVITHHSLLTTYQITHHSLLTTHQVVKILDLGLARFGSSGDGDRTTSNLTPTGTIMLGTPNYLAPEQAMDFHATDIRADIYSLGCTFYFLVTGQPPFPGGSLAEKLLRHQQAEPPPLEQLRSDLPAGLAGIVRRMLAKQPGDRYQTPADVAADLAALLNAAGQPSAVPTADTIVTAADSPLALDHSAVMPRRDKPKSGPARTIAWLAAGCLVIATAILVFYALSPASVPTSSRGETLASPAGDRTAIRSAKFYSSAGDGRVVHYGAIESALNKSQWDAVHAGAGASMEADTTAPRRSFWVGSGVLQTNVISIARGFLVFDTSDLPDDAEITQARVGVFVTRKRHDLRLAEDFLVVVQGLQTSPSTLVKEDYSRAGNRVTKPTEGSHRIAFADITDNRYLEWTLNRDGLGWISKTGLTQLAVREGHDVLNVWPGYRSKQANYIEIYLSEQDGTTHDPYLAITYRNAVGK